jgi:hypothetical protein
MIVLARGVQAYDLLLTQLQRRRQKIPQWTGVAYGQ